MLLVNRSVFNDIEPNQETFNLADFLEQDKPRMEALAPGLQLELVAIPVSILFDKGHLQSIFDNLVENAAKYAGVDKPVTIITSAKAGILEISVKDEGKGISKKHAKKIFSPFYRIEKEETRKQKGTGLGLNIVQRLAAANNAQIRYENNKKGSQFIITLNHE